MTALTSPDAIPYPNDPTTDTVNDLSQWFEDQALATQAALSKRQQSTFIWVDDAARLAAGVVPLFGDAIGDSHTLGLEADDDLGGRARGGRLLRSADTRQGSGNSRHSDDDGEATTSA